MTGRSVIDTNLCNPGHFFACCGIMCCTDRMLDGVEAHFDGDRFVMTAAGVDEPAGVVLGRLKEGAGSAEAEDPGSPSSPVRLDGIHARLDFWDHFDDRPKIKLFAGQQTSEGVLRRCYDALCKCDQGGGPVAWKGCPRTGLPTGIDSDTRWTASDVGFSLNDQGMKAMRTYPLVEYLAHVGVQGYGWSRAGERYRYRTWGRPLPYGLAMAAAAGALGVAGARLFTFSLKASGSNKTFNMSREAAP